MLVQASWTVRVRVVYDQEHDVGVRIVILGQDAQLLGKVLRCTNGLRFATLCASITPSPPQPRPKRRKRTPGTGRASFGAAWVGLWSPLLQGSGETSGKSGTVLIIRAFLAAVKGQFLVITHK